MECVVVSTLIETDGRSRAVIPGHMNQRWLLQEDEDGSLLLQPASVVTDAGPQTSGGSLGRPAFQTAFQECISHLSASYHLAVTYQPAGRYWALQWDETAIFVVLALALAGFCLWWTRRRRS